MKELTPAEAVAVYVARAQEELRVSQAELTRRVAAAVGRSYSTSVAKAWLKRGNAPGDVLFALYRMTGLSLDMFAGMRQPAPSIEERFRSLERQYEQVTADLEQLRREVGHDFRKEVDGPSSRDTASRQA